MPNSRLLMTLLLCLTAASSQAAIYGYVDEQGVAHFSAEKSDARLLKPGGRLVYATCSLLKAENEDVAAAFSAADRAPQSESV